MAAAVVVGLVIAAGVIVVGAASRNTAAADCSHLERASADEAGVLARACDANVEVLAERSPWVTVVAKPDGSSHMTVNAVPARTNVNGRWEPIKTDVLVPSADAQIAHRSGLGRLGRGRTADDSSGASLPPGADRMLRVEAPLYPIWLNPGGVAGAGMPLGVIQFGANWVEMGFPLELPTPTVDGRVVTYDLGPGVHLTVSVIVDGSGVIPIVQLDSPQAAQWFKDALAAARSEGDLPGSGYEIPYPIKVSAGLTIRDVDGGGFEVVDGDANRLFSSPPSTMWDSSADRGASGPQERVEFPISGDQVAPVPVRVMADPAGGTVVVASPDVPTLSAADTAWPVRIDPALSASTATSWIEIQNNNTSKFKWTDTASRQGESMGTCLLSWSSGCNVNFTARLVWEFDDFAQGGVYSWTTALQGADITRAKFSADPGGRGSCASTQTDVWSTSGVNSGSNWGNITWANYESSLVGTQGDSCSDHGVRLTWDAMKVVTLAMDKDWHAIAFGMKAADESSSNGYKTYNNNAALEIDFNRAPTPPTGVKLTSPSVGCASGAARPWINTATPTMSGVVSDPDGGTVQAQFQVVNAGTETSVWQSATLAAVASGSASAVSVPAGVLVSGNSYGYRVRSVDPGNRWSGWQTATCEFSVDTVKPVAPSITPIRTGVAAVYESGLERGGVGLAGKFTLGRGASTDVVSFTYQFGSDAPVKVSPDASGNAVVSYTPTAAGPVTLTVTAADVAGNTMSSTYAFKVASAKEDAIWMFDEGTGSSAADSSGVGTGQTMTLSGTTWGQGPHDLFSSRPGDRGLVLNGSTAFGSTGPVVKTPNSFVVSAYVWLNAASLKSGSFTAVSQDGVTQSGFELGYTQSCSLAGGCWSFGMKNTDDSSAAATAVTSTVPVGGDRWVHLVGAQNATAKTINLWVCDIGTPSDPGDGNPVAASAARTAAPWTAAGAFTVGRGLVNGAAVNWWPGRIDNVRVYSGQVVSDAKIRRLCQGAEARDFTTDLGAIDPTDGN